MSLVAPRRTTSRMMTSTPTTAPMPIRSQRSSPLMTPLARAEIRVACGAARVCEPSTMAGGPPSKPKAWFIMSRTKGMTRAPATTPTSRAVC